MKKTTLILLLSLFFLASCKKSNEIQLEGLSEAELDSTLWDKKDLRNVDSTIANFDIQLSRGATWKAWMKLHKACLKNEFFKNPYYVGLSNTIDLGAIISSSDGLQLRLQDALDTSEVKSVVQLGNYATCGFTQDVSSNINTILGADVNVTGTDSAGLDAELSLKIQSSKKTVIKIDHWRINTIVERKLIRMLSESADANKKDFYQSMQNSSFRLITQVVEIKGLTTDLELTSEISPGLTAKLRSGVIANVANGTLQASLTFVNNRTIRLQSNDKVYVFIELKKATKVGT